MRAAGEGDRLSPACGAIPSDAFATHHWVNFNSERDLMCSAQVPERFKSWAARRCAFVEIGVCAVKLPNPSVRDFGKMAHLVVRGTVCRLKERYVRTSTGIHAQCFRCLDITSAPILLSSCLEWLGVPNATVQLPEGSVAKVSSRARPIIFPNTSTVGVYTVFVGDRQAGRFAANLLELQDLGGSSPEGEEERWNRILLEPLPPITYRR